MTTTTETIRLEVLALLHERRVPLRRDLTLDTSLVQDLGLDSLAFVDLTLRLEERFRLPEFPLQNWIDEESMRAGQRHTLRSLVIFTEALLREGGTSFRIT